MRAENKLYTLCKVLARQIALEWSTLLHEGRRVAELVVGS